MHVEDEGVYVCVATYQESRKHTLAFLTVNGKQFHLVCWLFYKPDEIKIEYLELQKRKRGVKKQDTKGEKSFKIFPSYNESIIF